MKKTLFIQIDNNSLPEGCGEDVEVLDCRCTNEFCSIVGDALVCDLKDEDGKPLYRLINPVGRLLMEFKSANEEAFNGIISKWYDYLGELLHKGTLVPDLTIRLPQTYVDWLLQSDNQYYESVGKELQKKKGVIFIPSEDVIDDIIASMTYKLSIFFKKKTDIFSFVIFGNPIICNNSFIIKRMKLKDVEFLNYDSWLMSYQEWANIRKRKEDENRIQKSFILDELILGITKLSEVRANIKFIGENLFGRAYEYRDGIELKFHNNILTMITIRASDKMAFNQISCRLLKKEMDYTNCDYYQLINIVENQNFQFVSRKPPHYDDLRRMITSYIIVGTEEYYFHLSIDRMFSEISIYYNKEHWNTYVKNMNVNKEGYQ